MRISDFFWFFLKDIFIRLKIIIVKSLFFTFYFRSVFAEPNRCLDKVFSHTIEYLSIHTISYRISVALIVQFSFFTIYLAGLSFYIKLPNFALLLGLTDTMAVQGLKNPLHSFSFKSIAISIYDLHLHWHSVENVRFCSPHRGSR